MKRMFGMLIVLGALWACAKESALDGAYAYLDGAERESMPSSAADGPGESGGGGGQVNGAAGKLTAGEWKDTGNWAFWGKLMLSGDYADQSAYWGFYTDNRVAVRVEDAAGKPVAGVKVALQRSGKDLWQAVTDNDGRAELFAGLFQREEGADASAFRVSVAGAVQPEAPVMTGWQSEQGTLINKYVTSISAAPAEADIAFIVDATGSMGDEIAFLKEDLLDILDKARQSQSAVQFRTAALFYRDEGDEYLTRHSDFNADFSVTHSFIEAQHAVGGGDYPEAVHTALEQGLQKLSWRESARARIAFLILDAPAHYRDDVVESLHRSVETYARLGIRIIPVAASGVDKNTEFMCRFFAVATGGTYVFLTDHSGIGGSHIQPTVGQYKVELLNDLILRLIDEYTRAER